MSIVASLVLALGGCSGGGEVTLHPYEMLHLTRPGSPEEVGLADPEVIRMDDTYYLYGTTDAHGFEMWSSDDLEHWTYGGVVWRPTKGSWNDHGDYWAPNVEIGDGGDIWMYYSADVRIGVAKATSPKGPFIDQLDHPLIGNGYGGVGDGKLTDPEDSHLANWDDRAWDAWFFTADDGSPYLYFAAMTPYSELRVVPMENRTTPAKTKPTVVVAAAGHTHTWEGFVREGPAVLTHDGMIYLMYSGNAWSNECYAIGVATARHPLGPFTRAKKNPILATNAAKSFYAPGHNGLVGGQDGEPLAFFHVKVDTKPGGKRRPMVARLAFAGDGTLGFVDSPGTTPPDTPQCREPTP